MRSLPKMLFPALLALAWSGPTMAETPTAELGEFTTRALTRLDQQFDRSQAGATDASLFALASPSQMECGHATSAAAYETCVVTAAGTPTSAVPAAIAATSN